MNTAASTVVSPDTLVRKLRQADAECDRCTVIHVIGEERLELISTLLDIWPLERILYYRASEVTPALNWRMLMRSRESFQARPNSPAGPQPHPVTVVSEWTRMAPDPAHLGETANRLAKLTSSDALTVLATTNTALIDRILSDEPARSGDNLVLRLRAPSYREVAQEWAGVTPREKILAYAGFGCSRAMRQLLDTTQPPTTNIISQALPRFGRIRSFIESELLRHSELRNVGDYRSLLAILGARHRTVDDIRRYDGKASRQQIARRLHVLVELGRVTRARSIDARGTAPFWYSITDPAWRFHYGFVQPRISDLDVYAPDEVWRRRNTRQWERFMTRSLHALLREALEEGVAHLSPVDSGQVHFYRGAGPGNRHRKLPLVAEKLGGGMVTGNALWNREPMSRMHLRNHLALLRRLAYEGKRWAQRALERPSEIVYLAAGGFTRRARREALSIRPRVTLLEPEDPYF